MATYSNAARTVGARKQRQPLPEAPSDSEYPVGAPPRTPRGLRPCDPAENQSQNLSKKENHEAVCALPLVGTEPDTSGRDRIKLARTGTVAVKQLHVLGAASLAGFEVITEVIWPLRWILTRVVIKIVG